MNELREKAAEIQHNIWSHWMKWMFNSGGRGRVMRGTDFGAHSVMCWVMHNSKKDRWDRQMQAQFFELSEEERESDRKVCFEHGIYDLLQEAYAQGYQDALKEDKDA